MLEFQKSLPNSKTQPYVAEERIIELAELTNAKFDTAKLTRLLRELNAAYNNDSFFTIGILVRAVIDHVSQVFGYATFAEVANNYTGTNAIEILARNGNTLHVRLSGQTVDVNHYDGSKPRTRISVEMELEHDPETMRSMS